LSNVTCTPAQALLPAASANAASHVFAIVEIRMYIPFRKVTGRQMPPHLPAPFDYSLK